MYGIKISSYFKPAKTFQFHCLVFFTTLKQQKQAVNTPFQFICTTYYHAVALLRIEMIQSDVDIVST